MERTVQYAVEQDERVRGGWYLANRDRFLAELAAAWARRAATPVRRVLDAGCGVGGLVEQLVRRGFEVTGVDADPASIELGRQAGRLKDARQADVTQLPFPDRHFDMAVCSEVFEHVPDDAAALRELRRVTSGPLLLTVPAHQYLWTDSDAILLHQRRYGRRDVMALAARAGVTLACLHPFGLLPGVAVLAYKCAAGWGKSRSAGAAETPLAARFHLPGAVDRGLAALFRLELHAARHGVLPWGHGWWFVVAGPTGKTEL